MSFSSITFCFSSKSTPIYSISIFKSRISRYLNYASIVSFNF